MSSFVRGAGLRRGQCRPARVSATAAMALRKMNGAFYHSCAESADAVYAHWKIEDHDLGRNTKGGLHLPFERPQAMGHRGTLFPRLRGQSSCPGPAESEVNVCGRE